MREGKDGQGVWGRPEKCRKWRCKTERVLRARMSLVDAEPRRL